MRDHLSNYVVGLVVYTFENLLERGRSLVNLMQLLGKCFPDAPLTVFQAAFCESPGLDSSDFKHVDWSTLSAELETSSIARFQARNNQKASEATILLRAALNETSTDLKRPNYLLLLLSPKYVAAHTEQVLQAFLAFGREAFNRLGAVYGYANMGTLGSLASAKSELDPPPALSPVDFRDLSIHGDIRDIALGVFWANLLSGRHVDLLGGPEYIAQNVSCSKMERLLKGGMLLVVTPSPLARAGEVDPNALGSMFNLLMSLDHSKSTIPTPPDASRERNHREIGFQRMKAHVRRFEEEYLKVGKVPCNHVWRPYRFCSQDVVLGLTVVCHSIDNNCLEVDVCMTSDVPEYEPGSGAKMMASFLLSEAYKCGGSMEIRFSEYVEGGRVPQTLCDLADTYGVTLAHVGEGRITPLEARRLYGVITEFSPVLQDHIEGLARAGRLSQERTCYAVHHGLWTRAELENIILGSARADSILGGDAQPEQRHLYLNDLLHARAAVMGGFLDRKLAKHERGDGNEALDLEDDVRPIKISFDATYYAKVYTCSEELPIPWIVGQGHSSCLPAGSELIVLLRARDVDDLALRFEEDLGLAGELAVSLGTQIVSNSIYILIPRDFDDLPQDLREHFAYVAQTKNVGFMTCPETTVSMDTDAARRLASGRIMRE